MKINTQICYKSNSYNREVGLVLGAAFIFMAATFVVKSIMISIGLSQLELFASLLVYVFWAFILLNFVLKNVFILPILFFYEIFYWLLFLVSLYFFPKNIDIFNQYLVYFRRISIVFIPCGVICAHCTSFNGVFNRMRFSAIIGSALFYFSFILGGLANFDYQTLGVLLTPFVLILFVNVLSNKSIITIIFFFLDVVLVLGSGRQSVVVIVVGCLLLFVIQERKHSKMIVLLCLIAISVLSMVLLFFDYIINLLISVVEGMGIDSYMLTMLVKGEFFSFSTRKPIFDAALSIINSQGIHASGLLGSITEIRNIHSWIAYPHNIVFDLLIDFGMVLGGLLLFLLFFATIKQSLKGELERRLIVVFLAVMSIIRLLVSSNYLIEGPFYILIIMLFYKQKVKRA